MVSVSDMTYTNIGIFNGEDNGVRFVFQAMTFRLPMWRMRLTLLPLPGIAGGKMLLLDGRQCATGFYPSQTFKQ